VLLGTCAHLAASFEKFLTDKIKVDGKTGVLGDIKVAREKTRVSVTTESEFSKR
jgi:large subunit ribosomal protein L22e